MHTLHVASRIPSMYMCAYVYSITHGYGYLTNEAYYGQDTNWIPHNYSHHNISIVAIITTISFRYIVIL